MEQVVGFDNSCGSLPAQDFVRLYVKLTGNKVHLPSSFLQVFDTNNASGKIQCANVVL